MIDGELRDLGRVVHFLGSEPLCLGIDSMESLSSVEELLQATKFSRLLFLHLPILVLKLPPLSKSRIRGLSGFGLLHSSRSLLNIECETW